MIRTLNRYILITLILLVAGFPLAAKDEGKKFTVVVDAGHGGKDIGATDNGVMEKNINLKVAKELETLIKKKMKNANVVMTRDGDTYLTLQQRADKANKSHGDLFISIHTNSVDKKNRNRKTLEGSSVYTLGLHKDENNLEVAMRENSVIELEKDYEQKYSGFDPQKDESYIIFEMAQKKNLSQSIAFAESVEKELVKSGRKERGVHQAGFWVLWATSMPSVLVELDFICNPESAKYISSDKGAKELAEAIFKAIQKYEASWSKSINGVVSQLNETYTEGGQPELEETYTLTSGTPVATARTRSPKTSKTQNSTPVRKNNSERRRRSNHSRELSLNKSYESDLLYFPVAQNYGVSSFEMKEELAQVKETKETQKVKAKKSREEKKREKEAKKKAEREEKKRRKDAHNAKLNKVVTVYKIQVLASADLLNQNNSRFCGLTPISTYKENNLYKYYYGESTDKAELEQVLADVKKKIPDAFIVSSQKTVAK